MSALQLHSTRPLWLRILASVLVVCSCALVVWTAIENNPYRPLIAIVNFLLIVCIVILFVPKKVQR